MRGRWLLAPRILRRQDALTRRALQKQLLQIWQEHKKTVLFITHSVPEAIFLADRIIVMTARLGSVKTEIRVALAHPRDTTSAAFRDYERSIYAQLDEELVKSFAVEAADLRQGAAAD